MHVTGSVLVQRGWETFRKHILYVWALFAILIGSSVFFGLLEKSVGEKSFAGLCVRVASLLFLFLLQLGFLRMLLHLVRKDEELGVEELFSQRHIYTRAFFAHLCYMLLVFAGLIFLIVPGIYFAIRYYFLSYIFIDTQASFEEAFRKAADMTRGKTWDFFLFFLLLIGFNLLGLLLLGVGLTVTLPVSALAIAHAYAAMGPKDEKEETIKSLSEEKPTLLAEKPLPLSETSEGLKPSKPEVDPSV
ncbi:MAG: hypothetical protein WDN67_00455 [Candidatus Moraniibacteriota bacterium]